MVTCSNCGQANAEGTFVCRYCGAGLSRRPQATQAAEYVPPQSARGSEAPAYGQVQPYAPQPQPQAVFRCPVCTSTHPPQVGKRISTDGWVVFGLLLFFCPPFFWIGLLMKEEYRICMTCGSKFG